MEVSKAQLWTGRVFTTLVGLFMLMDGVAKLVKPDAVVKSTLELGYPESLILPLGIVLLIATGLYLVPRTAVLGAILLSAYLGGAVASHVRIGNPLFNSCFAIALGVLAWGGLYLRDRGVQALVPWKK